MEIPLKTNPIFSFTIKYPARANILINDIELSFPFIPGDGKEPPQRCKFKGIWDTGASGTVISNNVVKKCNLLPIDMINVYTAGGTIKSNVYLVNIFLPNKIMIPQLRVVEGVAISGGDILIGMDIIGRGDFAVTNYNNITIFSFRMPSQEQIDFVKNPKLVEIKPPRNSACPCGSGKKYKQCCGKIA
jgi:predicted aspartyl protease